MSIAGGPDEVRADPALEAAVVDEGEKICEVLVLDAKLPNNRSGVTYLFDSEIYVQVKQKHAERVTAERFVRIVQLVLLVSGAGMIARALGA